jgi:hypothetical protein
VNKQSNNFKNNQRGGFNKNRKTTNRLSKSVKKNRISKAANRKRANQNRISKAAKRKRANQNRISKAAKRKRTFKIKKPESKKDASVQQEKEAYAQETKI